jgi:hypothetical protein
MKMKLNLKLLGLVVLIIIAMPVIGNDSIMTKKIKIDSLLLIKADLPDGYKLIDKEIPITDQASSLYNQIDMYSMILKIKAIDKKYQSIKSSKDNGTVYYILFDGPADKAKGFAQGLVWGTKEPNSEHPDEIIVNENLLIILSFKKESKIKEIVKIKIADKIKK